MFFSFSLPKEIEKLRLELSESRQHVEQEQQKAARAREECLKVTELLGESEHQLHLTRYALIPLHTQH
jgi:serologically defined colon cancer antigen 8